MMLKKQRGMGVLPALCLLAVIIVIATCAVRLLPIYVDYWTLGNIIDDVVEEHRGKESSPAQIRSALGRHFTTNRIESLSLRDIEISTASEGIVIDASHEKRTALMFNIDAVVKFDGFTVVVPRS